MNRIGTIAALFAALTLLAIPARAERCPVTKGTPKVYAIGSSTLGSVLGPMLKRTLKSEGVEMSRWGRASSGLARPDFHDWLSLAPGLMRKHRPDIVVVSLGTNDFQPLFVKKGKWIRLDSPKWETTYAKRVDKLLARLAGKKKQRLVIWMGPHAFAGTRAQKVGPIVNRIMKERVEAFVDGGGDAVFVDAYAATLDRRGKPLEEAKLPGRAKVERIRTPDDIHLTTDAVRWLMEEPILAHIRPCLPSAEPVATKHEGDELAGGDGAKGDDDAKVEAKGATEVEAKADDEGATAQDGEATGQPSGDDGARAADESGDDATGTEGEDGGEPATHEVPAKGDDATPSDGDEAHRDGDEAHRADRADAERASRAARAPRPQAARTPPAGGR